MAKIPGHGLMSDQAHKVCIVVDPDFGDRLSSLPSGIPVWIADSPANTPVAHRLWKERTAETHLTGITTFEVREGVSPEDSLLSELDTIDLHHGSYSADPPYSQIEVFGTPLSEKIELALQDYGFTDFLPTAHGFSATRSLH